MEQEEDRIYMCWKTAKRMCGLEDGLNCTCRILIYGGD